MANWTNDQNNMSTHFTLPNLLSLSRIGLAPLMLVFLSNDDGISELISLVILILAGVTDGLDGYLARVRNQITELGIALDPIADKIFAAIVIIGLILYRQFPLWLAAVIVGRDLLILVGGLVLMRGKRVSLPSNLAGKYAFLAISILLASYIIRFDFGVIMTTIAVLVLLTVSLLGYGKVFLCLRKGTTLPQETDSVIWRRLRITFNTAFTSLFLYRLYTDIVAGLW